MYSNIRFIILYSSFVFQLWCDGFKLFITSGRKKLVPLNVVIIIKYTYLWMYQTQRWETKTTSERIPECTCLMTLITMMMFVMMIVVNFFFTKSSSNSSRSERRRNRNSSYYWNASVNGCLLVLLDGIDRYRSISSWVCCFYSNEFLINFMLSYIIFLYVLL